MKKYVLEMCLRRKAMIQLISGNGIWTKLSRPTVLSQSREPGTGMPILRPVSEDMDLTTGILMEHSISICHLITGRIPMK